MVRAFATLVMVVVLGMLSGCGGGYELRGRVVQGPVTSVQTVSKSQAASYVDPVPGALVRVTIDPHSLDATVLPTVTTDGNGEFSIPVSLPGAGVLIYDAQVEVSRDGIRSADGQVRLPGRGRRVLVVTPPGASQGLQHSDDILQRTLDDARPYLEQ
jgi:hypothetical protein